MKIHCPLSWAVLAFGAGSAVAQTQPAADPAAVVCAIQDERLADVIAVQKALEAGGAPAKAAILAAFRQRENARAVRAGAASLQAELARQAAQSQAGAAAPSASRSPAE